MKHTVRISPKAKHVNMTFASKSQIKQRAITATSDAMLHYRRNSDEDATLSAIVDRNPALFPRDYLKPFQAQDFPLGVRRSQVMWDSQRELLQRATEATKRMEAAKARFYAWPSRHQATNQCQNRFIMDKYRDWAKVAGEGTVSKSQMPKNGSRKVHFSKDIEVIRI
ncbi:uncharacterized protein LOC119731738 [Patiria miniata]|uniref:Uncharacterized protein n=1 Tax=Patiria miniata TaxID=46514 RepID=A0A914AC42_PATMI|nr:uncharacterized protein LOC119731738 [Patiria miniata]